MIAQARGVTGCQPAHHCGTPWRKAAWWCQRETLLELLVQWEYLSCISTIWSRLKRWTTPLPQENPMAKQNSAPVWCICLRIRSKVEAQMDSQRKAHTGVSNLTVSGVTAIGRANEFPSGSKQFGHCATWRRGRTPLHGGCVQFQRSHRGGLWSKRPNSVCQWQMPHRPGRGTEGPEPGHRKTCEWYSLEISKF